MKKILNILIIPMPWKIKRFLLVKFWKYQIHPTAKIGLAYIFPNNLIMEKGSRINHFTVAINLDTIVLKENSSINRSNWITGFPQKSGSKHFQHQLDRKSQLIVGKESSITKNHHLDCTNIIEIGNFTTIAGYSTQFLTHSVDIYKNIQDSSPIKIGDYCFVGTNCVILGGSTLPSFSVLGAKSLLNKSFTNEHMLYAGVSAKPIKSIDTAAKYFHRKSGFIA
ncbi:acyltransferase [Cellulophaga baltica]|uniref:acyltransferase n=1 Tax=Cellulophaga baltica TaxID=76594 RepID=UPI0015F5B933|nr:acyltransferase [Cellulophaga baltica]MBA6315447.1 acyltransferase [Cellulophaga baltica]